MIPKTKSEIIFDMKQSLTIQGIGLILVGFIHFIFSSYLNPFWGGLLIVIGLLTFFIISRYMFLLNGAILILASILNGYVFITASAKGIDVFGGIASVIFFQFIWGLEEIVRFREYGFSEIESNLKYSYKSSIEPNQNLNIARPDQNIQSGRLESETAPEILDQAAKLRARLDALAKARVDKG